MNRHEEINAIIEKAKQETTNKNTIAKLDKLKPKRKILDKLKKKDITQNKYIEVLRSVSAFLYKDIEKRYPFTTFNDKSINFKLTKALITFYNLLYAARIKDNVKIYPISIDEKTAKNIYQNELKSIIGEHLTSDIPYEVIINNRINTIQEKINFYKHLLSEKEFVSYYGEPEFMYEQAIFINECIKKLPFDTKNLDTIIAEMKAFIEKYPEVSTKKFPSKHPYFDKTYKTAFEKFEENYLHILEYEKSLMPKVAKIWQEYLTNPNNHNNESFKYIIHTFTNGLVPPNQMQKACCSLATEKLLTTPYGNCGLIYDFNIESIETICSEDADSFPFTKEMFIDQDFPLECQVTPNQTSFSISQLSKLILPTDLEKISIANNLVYNHELLNYSYYQAHTELFLNSKAKPIGVFYTDDCQDITEIKAYADKYNLPLIYLSLQELRVQAGLNPLATKIEPNKEVNNSRSY